MICYSGRLCSKAQMRWRCRISKTVFIAPIVGRFVDDLCNESSTSCPSNALNRVRRFALEAESHFLSPRRSGFPSIELSVSLAHREVPLITKPTFTPNICGQFVSRISSTEPLVHVRRLHRMSNAQKVLVAATFEKAKT